MTLGLISDTHGLLRPQALAALEGVDAILHAGDIGKPAVLEGLRAIAPVHAVRGNVDRWAGAPPETLTLCFEGVTVHLLHDLSQLEATASVIVSGHSHKPVVEQRGGVLYVNPGSAGPRRFSLPVAMGRLRVDGVHAEAAWFELDVPPPRQRP
ncbi:MAG: metallophosphoesterase family protein [Alphaproteobacteria bacterium]|nr:metallophosphoesterase family protein [Alphaproteobacteria bacterium]